MNFMVIHLIVVETFQYGSKPVKQPTQPSLQLQLPVASTAQSAHKELHRVNFAPSPLPSVHTSSHHEVSDWGSVSAWEMREWKEKSRNGVKQIKENEVISPRMTDHCVCPMAADKLDKYWKRIDTRVTTLVPITHTHTHTHTGLFYNVLS